MPADKILCCVNDSDHALKAALFAARISTGLECPLILLAVNRLRVSSGFAPMEQWKPAEIRGFFRRIEAAIRAAGLKVAEQVSLDAFDVSQAIVDHAVQNNCTHIVVGTGNPPFLGKLLMGSVSAAVVSKARCTVTVVAECCSMIEENSAMAKGLGLLSAQLREDLTSTDIASIRQMLEDEHPVDIAELISGLDTEAAWTVLEQLARDREAKVFAYLDTNMQVALALSMRHHRRLGEIVSRMGADDRADFYKELPPQQQQALLPLLAQAEREDIRRLASYDEGTAGALMTSAYASLPEKLNAEQALEMLRAEAPSRETIYRAYVIDGSRRLVGSLRLQDLILAQPGTGIGQIMDRNTLTVRIDDDQEEVARKISRYDILALPVLDGDNRLVGIVTYDDAMDVLQEEATEDFHKSGTVQGLSQSIASAPIGVLYRARVMWLVLLVFGNIFSSAGIAAFEETIEAHVALVFFLPLLIGSGGNAGAQAATLMVRGMSTGDVALSDWGRLVGRELLVAILLGLTMAAAVSLIGYLRGGIQIAWIVTLSMAAIVIIGSLIGMCLPFILSRSKLDPATASAPLVTSIADAVGVLIYFAIATLVLQPLAS